MIVHYNNILCSFNNWKNGDGLISCPSHEANSKDPPQLPPGDTGDSPPLAPASPCWWENNRGDGGVSLLLRSAPSLAGRAAETQSLLDSWRGNMPQFELGGSVSSSVTMTKDNNYTSSFAQELARESLLHSDSVYKSSFATELMETSNFNTSEVKNNSDGDDSNIYENINIKDSLESHILQQSTLNDSSDFKRLSQVSITNIWEEKKTF